MFATHRSIKTRSIALKDKLTKISVFTPIEKFLRDINRYRLVQNTLFIVNLGIINMLLILKIEKYLTNALKPVNKLNVLSCRITTKINHSAIYYSTIR